VEVVEHHWGYILYRPLALTIQCAASPAEKQDAQRIASVKRTVASATHVVRATPVYEFVPRHGGYQYISRIRAS